MIRPFRNTCLKNSWQSEKCSETTPAGAQPFHFFQLTNRRKWMIRLQYIIAEELTSVVAESAFPGCRPFAGFEGPGF